MLKNLKNSIIQIRNRHGVVCGTGFVIDKNIAVTCAHVVAAAGAAPGDSIAVAFADTGVACSAQILPDAWRPANEEDIAVLQFAGELPSGANPLLLGPSKRTNNHPFSAFGYPTVGNIQGVWAQGTILGTIVDDRGTAMLQVRAQEIAEGMSGAPVLDTDCNRIVGMVTATYYNPNGSHKLRDVAFATPVETIAQVYPELELVPSAIIRHNGAANALHSNAINQAPPMPSHFVPRPEITDGLKQKLLNTSNQTIGRLNISAIMGLGGIGKSTLAAALAHDPEIQHHFSDGILWATLGQEPDILSLLNNWIQALGDYEFQTTTIEFASNHLRNLLMQKAVLLVLDDVWEAAPTKPLAVCSLQGHILVTTRRFDVVDEINAARYELEVMSPAQALQLLTARMGRSIADAERSAALRLGEAVGFLPLALELAAARVARGASWVDLRRALKKEVAQLEALETPRRRRRKQSSQVEASFNLSLKALEGDEEETRQAFIWLGILPEDVAITAPMAATLWQMNQDQAIETLEMLWSDALLLSGPAVWIGEQEWPSYRLHDLLRDIARRLLTMPAPHGLGFSLTTVHNRLLERYRAKTQGDLWHTLPPDGYIHTHLTWHMKQAGRSEQVHALLREESVAGRNGWYHVSEQLGQTAGFLADANLGLHLAFQQFSSDTDAEAQSRALGLQVRYALIIASINSLARNLPLPLLVALVESNLWTPAQGLAYAHRVLSLDQQVKATVELSLYLSPGLKFAALQKAIQTAKTISNPWDKTEALFWLVKRLIALNEPLEALTVAQEISNETWRVKALTRLIPHIPTDKLDQIITAVKDIREAEYRAQILVNVTAHLPTEAQADIAEKLLTALRNVTDEELLTDLLASVAPHLPKVFLPQLLEIAEKITWEGARAEALAEISQYLPNPLRAETLQAVLAATRSIRLDEMRHQVLIKIAGLLPQQQLSKAVASAWLIKSKKTRAKTLVKIAPHLPEPLYSKALQEALAAIEATQDPLKKARLASSLLPALPPVIKQQAIEMTFTPVRHLTPDWKQAEVVAALMPHLPERLLVETLDLAHTMQDQECKTTVMACLGPRLAENQHLDEAFTACRSIKNKWRRAKALADLAPHLPDIKLKQTALQEALGLSLAVDNQIERAAALADLAPQLVELGSHDEAMAAIENIWHEKWRAKALAGAAPNLPESKLIDALKMAQAIRDSVMRARALVALAPHLPEPLLADALQSAEAIQDQQERAKALLNLAPHLPEPLKQLAMQGMVTVIKSIWRNFRQLDMLIALMPHLPAQKREEILAEIGGTIWDSRNPKEQAQSLMAIAPYMPRTMLGQTLDTVQAMPDESLRANVLQEILPYLSDAQFEQVLAIIQSTKNCTRQARMVSGAAPYLPARLHPAALHLTQSIPDDAQRAKAVAKLAYYISEPLLPKARQIAQSVQNIWERSEPLAGLSLRLAQLGQPEQALELAKTIWDEVKRAIVMARLLPYLPDWLGEKAQQELLTAYQTIWYAKWRTEVLAEMALFLPRALKDELMEEALSVTAAISSERKRADALANLVPHLKESLLPDALQITEMIEDNGKKAGLLAQFLPLLPQWLHPPAQKMIGSIDDVEMQATLQVELALYLPVEESNKLLEETLTTIWSLQHRDKLTQTMAAIVPLLTQLPPDRLATVWQEIVIHLTKRRRSNLLTDLHTLEPIIFMLGGPVAMAEISRAIQDTGRWWP